MRKVNTNRITGTTWTSPSGVYEGMGLEISEELGRVPTSTDLNQRHPFDVEIMRVPAGKKVCPFHSHSMQWEFYHIVSGTGSVRHDNGTETLEPGDAFIFKPGDAHQLINDGAEDLVFYCIADNPIGESCHYPDSGKWLVRSPERRLIRSEPLDYFDGEE